MASEDDIWLPLVDEPIGELVSRVQAEDTQLTALVNSPRKQLAFRTFAYIRVGLLLGELLVDADIKPDQSGTWVDQLLADPSNMKAIADEIRKVAHEVASDPKSAEDEPVGPDEDARERFRRFAAELD